MKDATVTENLKDVLSDSIIQYFSTNFTSPIGEGYCSYVFRNTHLNVPCSIPKVSGPPAAVGALGVELQPCAQSERVGQLQR